MSKMRPKKKARIIALIPSSRSGRFYRRRDGTIAKYKQLPRSSRPRSSRPGYKPRKLKEAMDPKLMEEAVNHWPARIARIIALPAGSRCGQFYKRKDWTIVKYKHKRRQIIEGCQDAISDFRHTIEAGVKTISDLTENRRLALAERATTVHLDPAGALFAKAAANDSNGD